MCVRPCRFPFFFPPPNYICYGNIYENLVVEQTTIPSERETHTKDGAHNRFPHAAKSTASIVAIAIVVTKHKAHTLHQREFQRTCDLVLLHPAVVFVVCIGWLVCWRYESKLLGPLSGWLSDGAVDCAFRGPVPDNRTILLQTKSRHSMMNCAFFFEAVEPMVGVESKQGKSNNRM